MGESPSLSSGSQWAIDKDELLLRDNYLFELGLSLGIEIVVIGSDSSINHPNRSKFELDEDTGLNVLKVTTRRTSVRG